MGFFDKVMFWKRGHEAAGDFGIPPIPQQPSRGIGSMPSDELGLDLPQQPIQSQPMQPLSQPSYQQPYQPRMDSLQTYQSYASGKEIEIVSAKLDAIRAALDNISQRLANLERAAYGEQQQQPQYQYRKGW